MPKAKLQDFVHQDEAGWRFDCPIGNGQNRECGAPIIGGPDDGGWRGFSSVGWPDKAHALARFEQHVVEHRDGEIMQDMQAFMLDNGIKELLFTPQDKTVQDAVSPQDLIGAGPQDSEDDK